MRAALLAYNQSVDERPAHLIAKNLIPRLLATLVNGRALAVEVIPKKLYQLNTEESLHDTRQRFKKSEACLPIKITPHKLNSPSSYSVMTLQSYPEPNRSTTIHPHQAFLTACMEARKRKAADERTGT